jgi:hypothetical protein
VTGLRASRGSSAAALLLARPLERPRPAEDVDFDEEIELTGFA